MIGGLIMTHSDDDGLIIPKIAPIQVAIVPIFNNDKERRETMDFAEVIANRLREKIDQLQIKKSTARII